MSSVLHGLCPPLYKRPQYRKCNVASEVSFKCLPAPVKFTFARKDCVREREREREREGERERRRDRIMEKRNNCFNFA